MSIFFKYLFLVVLIHSYLLNGCKKPICKKSRTDKFSGIIVRDFDFGECYLPNPPLEEYIITDDSTYQSIALTLNLSNNFTNRPECKNAVPEAIDFSKHSLLGKYVRGRCAVFKSEVINDNINKQYLFSIEVIECWPCKKSFEKMIWVLVPKLPQDYTVKFELK